MPLRQIHHAMAITLLSTIHFGTERGDVILLHIGRLRWTRDGASMTLWVGPYCLVRQYLVRLGFVNNRNIKPGLSVVCLLSIFSIKSMKFLCLPFRIIVHSLRSVHTSLKTILVSNIRS